MNERLLEDIKRLNSYRVDWDHFFLNHQADEAFIEALENSVNWNVIVYSQKVSERLIVKHVEEVNLEYVFRYQSVSEEFINSQKERLDKPEERFFASIINVRYGDSPHEDLTPSKIKKRMWKIISLNQNISLEFALENNLNLKAIIHKNKNVSSENREAMEKYLELKNMFA